MSPAFLVVDASPSSVQKSTACRMTMFAVADGVSREADVPYLRAVTACCVGALADSLLLLPATIHTDAFFRLMRMGVAGRIAHGEHHVDIEQPAICVSGDSL